MPIGHRVKTWCSLIITSEPEKYAGNDYLPEGRSKVASTSVVAAQQEARSCLGPASSIRTINNRCSVNLVMFDLLFL
jgi:hypothetical protein